MFEKRTDLALETHEINAERNIDDGIAVTEKDIGGCRITEATVSPGEGEKRSGKPAGRYVTIEFGKIWQNGRSEIAKVAEAAAAELKKLMPKGGCVLAAGLGNGEITPDSVGPRAIKDLIVTRHLRKAAPELYSGAGFGELAAVAPGVLGQTGIESADIIRGICEKIKPACVIIIDSLASRRMARLATTLQISDGGISPGSGIFNRRAELSSRTLGAPVVSIGVPTVVDAATLAADVLEESGGGGDFDSIFAKLTGGSGRSIFVAPKDCDVIAASAAKLIAAAINSAVHGINFSEMSDYLF